MSGDFRALPHGVITVHKRIRRMPSEGPEYNLKESKRERGRKFSLPFREKVAAGGEDMTNVWVRNE